MKQTIITILLILLASATWGQSLKTTPGLHAIFTNSQPNSNFLDSSYSDLVHSATNGFAITALTNWCERIDKTNHKNAVNDLARAGVICAVLGHFWAYYPPGHIVRDAKTLISKIYVDESRFCPVCNKTETKQVEWK